MGAKAQIGQDFPIIDAQKLQIIRNLAEPDDADGFFKDLVAIFFQRVPSLLQDIELALQDHNGEQLERSAHALKGTAGHLGAIWMMKLAEHLEGLGRQRNLHAADGFLDELKSVYPLTRQELEDHWL